MGPNPQATTLAQFLALLAERERLASSTLNLRDAR